MRNNNINVLHNSQIVFYLGGGLLFLFLAMMLRPFTIVNAGERGVVMQFGKVQDTVLDEGLHPIIPIVTTVKKLNVRVQQNSFNAGAASKDLQTITTELAVNWHIVDDVSLVNFSFSPEFSRAIEAKQIAEQEAKQASFIAQKATQEAQAEVNRAKGQAEAQRLQRLTLTPELLQKQAIEKWDGRFPMVMGGNGAVPLININPNDLATGQKRN